jgi:hypothetical protein
VPQSPAGENNIWYSGPNTGIRGTDNGGNVKVNTATDVDSNGNLIGSARTSNLGISGYEVA